MKTLKSLSARFLKLFLSEIPAGACIPEHGQCCTKKTRFDCYGSCKASSTC